MTGIILVATVVGYLVGIGATFQMTEVLNGRDMYGRDSRRLRCYAAMFWPITAGIAAGVKIAQRIQDRRTKPPRAIATERSDRRRAVSKNEAV